MTDFANNTSSHIGNIQELWLFDLSYAGYSSGTLRLSTKDYYHSSNFYHGAIVNNPRIRESLDLKKSIAKSSNVSISVADFKYKGTLLSEWLFGSSTYFINQTVTVKSVVNNSSTAITIGTYRFIKCSSNGNTISIELTSHRPWDFIMFPQRKTTVGNVYVPVVYGDFTPETSTVSSPDFCEDAIVWKTPVAIAENRVFQCIMPQAIGSDGRIHYYEKNVKTQDNKNIFIPLDDANNSSENFGGDNAITTSTDLDRAIKLRPISIENIARRAVSTDSYVTLSDLTAFNNTTNAVSGDVNTYSEITQNLVHGNSSNALFFFGSSALPLEGSGTVSSQPNVQIRFDIGTLDHEIQSAKVTYKLSYAMTATVGSHGADDVANEVKIRMFMYDETYGDVDEIIDSGYTTGTNVADGNSVSISQTTASYTSLATKTPDGSMPSRMKLGIKPYIEVTSGAIDAVTLNVRIYDVLIEINNKIPIGESNKDYTALNEAVSKVDYLYCGANGLTHGITGLSGNAITYIHDAHLDLLNRFAGLDVASNPATNIEGWGNGSSDNKLDHTRGANGSQWKIRYWQLEPTELKSTLERLQYEGGFIFRYKKGNVSTPEYIFIKNSYSDTDYEISKQDLKNIKITPDGFNSLMTNMEIEYDRHPVEDNKYMIKTNSINSTSRSNFNITDSKENKSLVKLNMYVSPTIPNTPSSNPNDDFYTYYNNIYGDIKLHVSGEVINTKYYDMDIGETIEFSDMYPEKAFGKAFTNVVFMIISITRSLGSLKFTAREIGAIT